MNWFKRLIGRGINTDGTPTARDIHFDTEGWEPAKQRRRSREWRDSLGNTLYLDIREGPSEHLTGPLDLESLTTLCRRQVEAKGGAIVSVEVVEAAGVPCLETIDKYERLPAYEYEGSFTIPLVEHHCSVVIHAAEHGVTGGREAVVTAHLIKRGNIDLTFLKEAADSDRRVVPGWFQDPYDPGYSGPVLRSASDDARLDNLFPDHPLSRVRSCLTRIRRTLKLDLEFESDFRTSAEMPDIGKCKTSVPLIATESVASLFLGLGRYREAEEQLAESLVQMERSTNADPLGVAKQYAMLGHAREFQGKIEEARSAFADAKDGFEAVLGEDHPTTAQAVVNLARMLILQGNHDAAEPLFQRGLRISEAADDGSSNVGVALNGLGIIYNVRGSFAEAITCFERALEIIERVHGPDFPAVAGVLRNMAYSWNKIGDHQRMREVWERADLIDPAGAC